MAWDDGSGSGVEAAGVQLRLRPADPPGAAEIDVTGKVNVVETEPPEPSVSDAIDPESAAPFAETEAAIALAEVGITLEETEPELPPGPRRSLEERPRTQAGNVEVDAEGLLQMLGIESRATLAEISEAHRRFVADHDPSAETDQEAAIIKERIRRQINMAYASFRLTRSA